MLWGKQGMAAKNLNQLLLLQTHFNDSTEQTHKLHPLANCHARSIWALGRRGICSIATKPRAADPNKCLLHQQIIVDASIDEPACRYLVKIPPGDKKLKTEVDSNLFFGNTVFKN